MTRLTDKDRSCRHRDNGSARNTLVAAAALMLATVACSQPVEETAPTAAAATTAPTAAGTTTADVSTATTAAVARDDGGGAEGADTADASDEQVTAGTEEPGAPDTTTAPTETTEADAADSSEADDVSGDIEEPEGDADPEPESGEPEGEPEDGEGDEGEGEPEDGEGEPEDEDGEPDGDAESAHVQPEATTAEQIEALLGPAVGGSLADAFNSLAVDISGRTLHAPQQTGRVVTWTASDDLIGSYNIKCRVEASAWDVQPGDTLITTAERLSSTNRSHLACLGQHGIAGNVADHSLTSTTTVIGSVMWHTEDGTKFVTVVSCGSDGRPQETTIIHMPEGVGMWELLGGGHTSAAPCSYCTT